jgi:hypothetical protein
VKLSSDAFCGSGPTISGRSLAAVRVSSYKPH